MGAETWKVPAAAREVELWVAGVANQMVWTKRCGQEAVVQAHNAASPGQDNVVVAASKSQSDAARFGRW